MAGKVQVIYISTHDMNVDILTKRSTREKHFYCVELMDLVQKYDLKQGRC